MQHKAKFALLLTKQFPKCSLLKDFLHSQSMMHISSAWWCTSNKVCIHCLQCLCIQRNHSQTDNFALTIWIRDSFKMIHLGTMCFKECAFPELIYSFWFLHCGYRRTQVKKKVICWGCFVNGNKSCTGSLQTMANSLSYLWPYCFLGFFTVHDVDDVTS